METLSYNQVNLKHSLQLKTLLHETVSRYFRSSTIKFHESGKRAIQFPIQNVLLGGRDEGTIWAAVISKMTRVTETKTLRLVGPTKCHLTRTVEFYNLSRALSVTTKNAQHLQLTVKLLFIMLKGDATTWNFRTDDPNMKEIMHVAIVIGDVVTNFFWDLRYSKSH